jgi:hypothetical protein
LSKRGLIAYFCPTRMNPTTSKGRGSSSGYDLNRNVTNGHKILPTTFVPTVEKGSQKVGHINRLIGDTEQWASLHTLIMSHALYRVLENVRVGAKCSLVDAKLSALGLDDEISVGEDVGADGVGVIGSVLVRLRFSGCMLAWV